MMTTPKNIFQNKLIRFWTLPQDRFDPSSINYIASQLIEYLESRLK